MSVVTVLAALALLQIKHYLADFHWQSDWMVINKGRYGHPGGLAHAGLHGVLSLLVLALVAPWLPLLFVLLVLAEIAVHYHTDWLKARIVTRAGIDVEDPAYWHWLGLDQAVHQLTYLAMLAALALAVAV